MKRNTFFSVILLVVLGIVAYFVIHREDEISSTGSSGKMLVDYDSTAVDKLDITSPTGSVALEKEAGTWMLTSPLKYRADETAVTTAVGKGRKIELSSLVSTNPENQHLFQVDSTGTLVRVFEKGTLKAAFRVGKASSSFTETYVRLDGSNDVQLANDVLTSTFSKSLKDWRDKTIFKIEEGKIKGITFQYGDTTFMLTLQDSLWRIQRDSVNQTLIKPLLAAFASMQADEFVDSIPAALPKLSAIVTVDGTQIRFYKKDDGKYLVQTSQSPQWFEIQAWRTTSLLKRKKDLLPAKG